MSCGSDGFEPGRGARIGAHGLERAEIEDLAGHEVPTLVQVAKQGRQARQHGRVAHRERVKRSAFDEPGDEQTTLVMNDLRRETAEAGGLVANHLVAPVDAQRAVSSWQIRTK